MPASRVDDRTPGVVYTPPEVSRPMVELALGPLLRDRASEELLALRICDPALGEGAFLVEVVDVLGGALAAAWQREGIARTADAARREVAARCIVGIDVDERAVATAREALEVGGDALVVGDALELDWPAAFPEVFARGGFDAIVGNPPYVRQEWLSGKPALRGFASYDGVADLYVYFLELAHRIARPGGRYCLITPNKWLTAAYGRPLRAYLAAQGSVQGLVDLSRAALFGDADAFPSIVWGTSGAPQRQPIQAARIEPGVDVATALRSGRPHARARWADEPWHIDAPRDLALIDRLERTWPALGDLIGRPARGVVTGCNAAFILDREARARLLDAEPAAEPLIRRFVKGRDLRRWLPDPGDRWILLVDRGTSLDDLPMVRAHLAQFREALEPRPPGWSGAWRGRKPGTYRWYELQDPVGALAGARTPRLLYQDIQTGPACCLDRGELVPDTTVWILPSADLYLLAVLNSPLYGWYARRRFPPALNGSVRPKLEYMRRLPIATPAPAARAEIEQLVADRLALEPLHRDGDPRAATTALELEAAISDAVLAIYELSPAERALIAEI